MAYKDKEHDYRRLERDLASGEIDGVNVIILCGHEDYLVKSYEKRIKNLYVNPAVSELDYVRLDGEGITVDTIISHAETFPIMSVKRVISIDGFPLPGSGNKNEGNSGGEDIKTLCSFIENMPETALIIFLDAAVDTRKALGKSIKNTGKIYDFERLDRKDLASFIKKKFKGENKIADNGIVREIINITGYFDRDSDCDLNSISGDVVKIASFSREDRITHADVNSVLSTSLEADAFALLDSISGGKKGDALLLINTIMETGESGFRLLGLIISQFELMLGIKEYTERGLNKGQIMNEMGVKSEFRYRKVSQYISRYSAEKLEVILQSLYNTEKNIKNGIYNEKLAMTMFVAGI